MTWELLTNSRVPRLSPSPPPLRGGTVPSQGSGETRGCQPVTPGFSPPAWGSVRVRVLVAVVLARPESRPQHAASWG